MKGLLAVVVVLAVLVFIVAGVLVSGGLYRTTNVGHGTVYIVNRFTGRTFVAQGGSLRRLRGERELAQEGRGEARRAQELQAKEDRERLARLISDAESASAAYVGDPTLKVFHSIPPLPYYGAPPLRACPGLGNLEERVFLDNALAALQDGYWPCGKCIPIKWVKVRETVTLRDWPDDDAPPAWTAKAGEDVGVIAEHGEWYAVSSELRATGKRLACWLPKKSVRVTQPR